MVLSAVSDQMALISTAVIVYRGNLKLINNFKMLSYLNEVICFCGHRQLIQFYVGLAGTAAGWSFCGVTARVAYLDRVLGVALPFFCFLT